MKTVLKQLIHCSIGAIIISGVSGTVHATPVTVTDVTPWVAEGALIINLSLPPNLDSYNGGIWDGINVLQITEGTQTFDAQGFCIDPFHFSASGPVAYNTVALADAPKPPGPMGAAAALQIEELWTEYFPSAQTDPTVAAGLQLAIWDIVADAAAAANNVPASSYFTLSDPNEDTYGAPADLAWVDEYGSTVTPANLIGLTGSGQDYVIAAPPPPTPTPDGGTTLVLLGSVMVGLQGLRRKFGCSR
jgi:hypothetical protein